MKVADLQAAFSSPFRKTLINYAELRATFLRGVLAHAESSGFISRKVKASAGSDGRDFSKRVSLAIKVRVTTGGFVPGAGNVCWLRKRI